jgi:hypothetical protein
MIARQDKIVFSVGTQTASGATGEGYKKDEHCPAPPPGSEPLRNEMHGRAHPVSRLKGGRPPPRT